MQTHSSGWRGSVPISFVFVVAALSCGACSEQIVETSAPLGGTCLACHDGITEVHPFFALACVDCHGGNDSIRLPSVVNIRDQELLKRSHVLPLDPSMWWPNGIDDNGNGRVDEIGEFFDGRALTATDTPFADARLATKGQMDSEVNRDLNYLRFLNPGDLRVADASCGSRNSNANAAMVCHAEVVYDVRRSMMSTNAGVPMAVYGNAQLPQASDFGTPFAASAAGSRFDARAGRVGRVGYTINYGAIDDAFESAGVDASRNLVTGGAFDRGALADAAGANIDPEDDAFEAVAGPIFDDGITGGDAAFDAPRGFTRTGQAIRFFVTDLDAPGAANNRAVDVLQNISNRAGRSWPDQRKHPGLQLRLARIVGRLSRRSKRIAKPPLRTSSTDAPSPTQLMPHSETSGRTTRSTGGARLTTSASSTS